MATASYVGATRIHWENEDEKIPPVTYPEIIAVLGRRSNHSTYTISPFLLDKIPRNYWHQLAQLYNHSFSHCFIPRKCKEVRMVILAKEGCDMHTRSNQTDLDAGLISEGSRKTVPETISENSQRSWSPAGQPVGVQGRISPTDPSATADRTDIVLYGKQLPSGHGVRRLQVGFRPVVVRGLPRQTAANWYTEILRQLDQRMAQQSSHSHRSTRKTIGMVYGETRVSSRLMHMPTLFITYHCDMAEFIPNAMSFFFADLAAVLAGRSAKASPTSASTLSAEHKSS